MVWIKICGITNTIDLNMAVKAGADALGFIVDVQIKTPRKITALAAEKLIANVRGQIDTVAVTTPMSAEEAEKIVELVQPDYLQIHNDLEVDEIKKIRYNTGVPVIKTIEVNSSTSEILKKLKCYEAHVDAVLLDSVKKGEIGVLHSWDVSARIAEECSKPVILAGGLNPENVAEAISAVKPFGVDVASGVESRAGRKDPEKLMAFIKRARQNGNF